MGGVSKGFKDFAAITSFSIALTISGMIFGAKSAAVSAAQMTHTTVKTPLCEAGETPIFSCPLGKKHVSVCGSGTHAIYRYGTPGKVELTSRNIKLAEIGYAGGGETQIQVENNGYSYILYDKTVRTGFGADGHHDADFMSGLLVRRAGKILSAKECDDDAPIPDKAKNFMPSGATVVRH